MEKYEWTDEGTKNFWNFFTSHAKRESEFFSQRYFIYLINLLKKYGKNGNYLDFGCGDGFLLKKFIHCQNAMFSHENSFYGIDYGSDPTTDIGDQIILDRFDPHESNLPYDQNFFSTISSFEVFEHLSNEKLDFIVPEFFRIVKPKGRIIVTVPNNEMLEKGHILCPNCNHHFHKMQHLQAFNSTSLVQLFEKHKFKLVKVIETNLNNYNSLVKRFASCFISYPNINLIGIFEKSS